MPISLFQALFHSRVWDVYIAPEHDTPRSLRLKVPTTHVPNILACLTFLVAYGNYGLFVALQTYGLVATSIAQRFPAPWARERIDAPTTTVGALGLRCATGYVGPQD